MSFALDNDCLGLLQMRNKRLGCLYFHRALPYNYRMKKNITI